MASKNTYKNIQGRESGRQTKNLKITRTPFTANPVRGARLSGDDTRLLKMIEQEFNRNRKPDFIKDRNERAKAKAKARSEVKWLSKLMLTVSNLLKKSKWKSLNKKQ